MIKNKMTNQEKQKYGLHTESVIEREGLIPTNLLTVPHKKDQDLSVNFPPLGAWSYDNNTTTFQYQKFSHPTENREIQFRPPTISEAISVIAHDPRGLIKTAVFDQLYGSVIGEYITKTKDGIFTNIFELNEDNLNKLLKDAKKTNGIYLINDKIAFVPYETFEEGIQESGKFAESGLARGLEHVQGKVAPKLKKITSEKNFPAGVQVEHFKDFKRNKIGLVGFAVINPKEGETFEISSNHSSVWSGGYLFGVLKENEE